MFPKFTNVFDGATLTIVSSDTRCHITALKEGKGPFAITVTRAMSGERHPALVALQALEKWYAHDEVIAGF